MLPGYKTIIKGLILCPIVFLVAFLGYFIYINRINLSNIPKAYIVLSGSMEPAVKMGSIVLIKKDQLYIKGDVVTFAPNGDVKNPVTHRISSSDDKGVYYSEMIYKTKGDANKTEDFQLLEKNNILGKVILTIPYLGYAVNFAKKPQGFILLVIVPATIIIYEELKSTKRELSNYLKRIKKDSGTPPPKQNTNINYRNAFVILPIIGVIFVGIAVSKSYFYDKQTSLNNVFGAASVFATPSLTPSPSPSGILTPTPSPLPIAQTLVINEVLPVSSCPKGNTTAEWLEVYNGYSTSVNLKDFKISDGTTTIALVNANNIIVTPGGFALLAHDNGIWGSNKCYLDNGVITANLGSQLNLNTKSLQLLDSNDNIIDSVLWSGTTGLNPATDQSIERNPDGLDSATGSGFSSSDFVVRTTPMPGL